MEKIMIDLRKAQVTHEGAGVVVKRLMPIAGFRNYDPFVLWDDFNITPGSGFPDHPHRGFEAITYLFNGSIRHEDNLGNASTVYGGGAQRFTAGRGIVHSEMPNEQNPTHGIQLWINLPKRLKRVEPGYQQVDEGEFPVNQIEGGLIKTIVGNESPLKLLSPVRYLEIQLEAGASYQEQVESGMRGLIYMVDGKAAINGQTAGTADATFFENETRLEIGATEASRIMLCYGSPHGEPIIQYGPFVD
jgi:redox-sensitive bicupin YhaK (pirin superfamily)